jgi:hypothetical protein
MKNIKKFLLGLSLITLISGTAYSQNFKNNIEESITNETVENNYTEEAKTETETEIETEQDDSSLVVDEKETEPNIEEDEENISLNDIKKGLSIENIKNSAKLFSNIETTSSKLADEDKTIGNLAKDSFSFIKTMIFKNLIWIVSLIGLFITLKILQNKNPKAIKNESDD